MRQRVSSTLAIAIFFLAITASFAFASTGTIVSPYQYAWDDNGGYVNFNATGGNVTVTDTALTGYIWSAGFGWINLSPTNAGVTNSDGTLSGSAWSTNTGWIDFTGVTIDSNGVFHGHTTAQSNFGTMTFDCTNCDVVTSWRPPISTPPSSGASSGGSGGNGQIVGSALSAPFSNEATTTASTQSLISSLQAQLQSLTARLAALTAAHSGGTPIPSGSALTFSRDLQLRDTGADVTALQQYLNSRGFLVVRSGPGSPGNETTYFGVATYRALKKFQAAHGIRATGYFGPLTRASINPQ
jgi:Putative peptidoglycan binding domain